VKNAEMNTGKAKPDITCSSPSQEAVALAVLLSGHTRCAKAVVMDIEHVRPCELCLGDAATIDRELKLKERNEVIEKARLLTQAFTSYQWKMTEVEHLLEALKAI